jgi:hypothetical protein
MMITSCIVDSRSGHTGLFYSQASCDTIARDADIVQASQVRGSMLTWPWPSPLRLRGVGIADNLPG